MTRQRDLKKLVRARMRKTGESYSTARAHLVSRVQPPRGGFAMYPFERFTEHAKYALQMAQEEAQQAERPYIGTEHLLLGLMREEEGLAAKALAKLGVEQRAVRLRIEQVIPPPDPGPDDKIIPTHRVKKVIELAFEQAEAIGHRYVGTEHLLLAVFDEGEGVGARVLRELGVTLNALRETVAAPLIEAGREPGGPMPSLRAAEIMGEPEALAMLALLLRRFGGAPPSPSDGIVDVMKAIELAEKARDTAVSRHHYGEAGRHHAEEERLRKQLVSALAAWKATFPGRS